MTLEQRTRAWVERIAAPSLREGEAPTVHPATKSVYVAQALDYAVHEQHLSLWFHQLPDYDVYCPRCAFVPGESPDVTMERNMKNLALRDVVVAIIQPDVFSFGTPIEIWYRAVTIRDPGRVCVVHPARPGLFIRHLEKAGVTVVQSAREALAWLASS